MIKLDNVSKYYHNEGIVTLALHKINLSFRLGEFVAITGESGSGKSTLLNVIAGIDSYEEGELYINGEETSYYDDDDWEAYRKDKIAFIFQNYNLIDSYTVLKNVEVALVIQGITKKERIERAKDIIDKVGLTSHIKHRASKLSGGQKQRLAIARALAKETNIIVADEPTGNLDSESGRQVLELLNKISKDKLVFIVTHNYEQASPYVSRKIRLFDGEVVEDKYVKEFKEEKQVIEKLVKPTKEINQSATIAKFNLFGQPKKSIFIFLVSLAVVAFIFFFYSSLMIDSTHYLDNSLEVNAYPERIIVTKKDRTELTQADYDLFIDDDRVEKVIKADSLIDANLGFESHHNNVYFNGQILFNLETTKDTLIGRFPENEDEVLLNLYYNDFNMDEVKNMINKEIDFYLHTSNKEVDGYSTTLQLKVVGINKVTNTKMGYIVTDKTLNKMYNLMWFNNKSDLLYLYNEDGSPFNYPVQVDLKIDETLTSNQVKGINIPIPLNGIINLRGRELEIISNDQIEYAEKTLYISSNLAKELYGSYDSQYTINLKNINDRVALEKSLYNKGYYTFSPYYDIIAFSLLHRIDTIGSIFSSLGFILIIIILYLISYLIFKLVMNTKIKDYTILRIIGARKTLISSIIRFELLISFFMSYIIFFIIYIIFIKKTYPFLENLRIIDYLIVFIINIFLSLLIARRFIKKQVKKSLYSNLRAE